MFRDKTVVVLGAGSSKEFGMPLGSELKEIIAKKLDFREFSFGKSEHGDKLLLSALKMKCDSVNIKTTERFLKGENTYDSIDDFLARHPDDKDFQISGKLAIVQSILEAESNSLLKQGRDRDELYSDKFLENYYENAGRHMTGSWLGVFIKRLVKGIAVNDVDDLFRNVSFINFNYDRCLEQGLVHGLARAYGCPVEDARQWVQSAKILRPYGSVGSYWKEDENFVPFGGVSGNENQLAEQLIDLGPGIFTYSEEGKRDEHREISLQTLQGQTYIFLGFHFHPQNIALLKPQPADNKRNSCKIFATAKNFFPNEIDDLKDDFLNFNSLPQYPNKVFVKDCSCWSLFDQNKMLGAR